MLARSRASRQVPRTVGVELRYHFGEGI